MHFPVAGGCVVEIGAGAGARFAHYPPTVVRVLAVEPDRAGVPPPRGSPVTRRGERLSRSE